MDRLTVSYITKRHQVTKDFKRRPRQAKPIWNCIKTEIWVTTTHGNKSKQLSSQVSNWSSFATSTRQLAYIGTQLFWGKSRIQNSVYGRHHYRFTHYNMVKNIDSSGGSIVYWAGLSSEGLTELAKLSPRMNGN